jgi:hypothetical protein
MKYAAGALLLALAAILPIHSWFASNNGFDAAVSAVEQQYHAQPENIPMQWFVSLCATVSTGGGVRHMRVANFDNIGAVANPDDLAAMLSSHLPQPWHRMVLSRDGAQDFSLIYVRPEGRSMRMLVASYDHGELDLVRMDLNGERLAHFVQNPAHSANQHNAIPD